VARERRGVRRSAKRCLELYSLSGDTTEVLSLAVTPDEQRAVSGSMGGTMKVWDLKRGKRHFTLQGHVGQVQGLAAAGRLDEG